MPWIQSRLLWLAVVCIWCRGSVLSARWIWALWAVRWCWSETGLSSTNGASPEAAIARLTTTLEERLAREGKLRNS